MNGRQIVRAALVAVAVGLAVAIAAHLRALHFLAQGAQAARSAGPLGVLAVGGAIVGLGLVLVPIIPMVLACGWIYGMGGVLLSVPALTLSAALAFLGGRAFGRRRLDLLLAARPRLRAIAELAERGGALTVALMRVSPVLPFSPSNAVLGMTGLRLRDLVLGTAGGLLPGALLYTSAGALLPDAAALQRGEAPRGPFWAMLALGVVSMTVIGTAAARKLRQVREERADPAAK